MSKYERLARLLKIITLVKSNSTLTRLDLARLCEVNSVRTIQRDINSLAIADVPIFWAGNGYEIMSDFFLPPLALTVEEALALVLSASAYGEGEGNFHRSSIESAISKIVASLPKNTRDLLQLNSDRISVESRNAMSMGGVISRLYQAVLKNRQLCINYYSYSRNAVTERIVDPYALTFRKRAWYLIAFCHEREDILMFRTNRIKTLDYTGRTFARPPDFCLRDYMAKSWQTMKGEETKVVVKFNSSVAPLIKEVDWHPTQHIDDLPDGSILYTVDVSGTKEISFWILSYGPNAEVISPESLREELAATTEKMYQCYRKN